MDAVKEKKIVQYSCDCCGRAFESGRARQGEKLCVDCIEIRRALKGFVKRGLSEAEVLKRGQLLLTGKGHSAE
jgi:hypothetical protein